VSTRAIITTGNVVFSLKTFLAAMLAYFLAIRFDLPRPFWAVATVYIVAHPLSGAISSKSLYRLLGTLLGGGATLVMVPNLVNEPVLLSTAIIMWVSACTFISLLDRTPRGYVFLLGGYTVLLAGLPLVTTPANTFDTVVSRVEEIGLAILCASIVSHVVFPVHVGTVLLGRIDGWMARAQTLCLSTGTDEIDASRSRSERNTLAADAADLRAFSVHLYYDGSRYRRAVSLVRSLQDRMVFFLPLLSEIEDLRHALAKFNTPKCEQALSRMAGIGTRSSDTSENVDARMEALPAPREPLSWENLLLANAARNTRDVTRVSHGSNALREAIVEENAARAARRFTAREKIRIPHRDIGMALLSALTVAICLATSTFFWIASGWTDGMTLAQISGVLCCLLATMDDPVPAMRKFVGVTIASVIAAFVYSFAILPMIDGFVPLVAALGLFLIPAGLCLAVPSLGIVGMGLCINFPLLLTLQAHQRSDFTTFANTGVATILAMVWAIAVSAIFRSVRAETNARRLLSVTQTHLARIAAGNSTDAQTTQHRIVDVAGLFASRAARLPPNSDLLDADLIRDLRAGLHITAMQELVGDVSRPVRRKAETVFSAMEALYRQRPTERAEPLKDAVGVLDDLILSLPEGFAIEADMHFVVHAAALRLCIAPSADPPGSAEPPSEKEAA